ncbi:MAG: hypothetical protein IJS52_06770 [Bacilli bacterium]|nr:hypothetical protein [Bacilli bacterium]
MGHNPNQEDAETLFRKGLALFNGDGVEKDEQEGAYLISLAAKKGHAEAKDWIDDYTFDDNAGVQGAS